MQPSNAPPSPHSCITCVLRTKPQFCDLGAASLQLLDNIAMPMAFESGAILCSEGEPATGIYILCTGKVKLSASSADGRTFILDIAKPGDLVGLPAVISQSEYDVTAQAEEPTKTKYVGARDFLRMLETHSDLGVKVAQNLTHTCQMVLEEIKSQTLSTSVPQKLAKLILHWERDSEWRPKLRVGRTHEEIAQMLGTSRETVSRTLRRFKSAGFIEVRGSTWLVLDQGALIRAAGTQSAD